jgi:hypothetical protein
MSLLMKNDHFLISDKFNKEGRRGGPLAGRSLHGGPQRKIILTQISDNDFNRVT